MFGALARRTHAQAEFAVDGADGKQRTFKTFAEALEFAVVRAASDGNAHNVDVLLYSPAAARWWGGDDAVEQYREDPDASVSDRVVIRAEFKGRVA